MPGFDLPWRQISTLARMEPAGRRETGAFLVIARSQRVPPSAGPMINSATKQSIAPRKEKNGLLRPDTVKGYGQLGQANSRTGSLGTKTRELIALAVAISLRCDGSIATHTAEAKKAGATKEEIAEALGVAISVNAGAALVYSARTVGLREATGSQ